jgi:hypothetical protein
LAAGRDAKRKCTACVLFKRSGCSWEAFEDDEGASGDAGLLLLFPAAGLGLGYWTVPPDAVSTPAVTARAWDLNITARWHTSDSNRCWAYMTGSGPTHAILFGNAVHILAGIPTTCERPCKC